MSLFLCVLVGSSQYLGPSSLGLIRWHARVIDGKQWMALWLCLAVARGVFAISFDGSHACQRLQLAERLR